MLERAEKPTEPNPVAAARAARPQHQLVALQRQVGNAAVARLVQRDAIPGFAQRGGTCEPASLLTAFLVWDRELGSPGVANGNMISACDAAQMFMLNHRTQLLSGVDRRFNNVGEYDATLATVARVRLALQTGVPATEAQFQDLADALSRVFYSADQAMRTMGITANQTQYNKLGDILGSVELTGLRPGEIAQIHWYVRGKPGRPAPSSNYHAFVIGRKANGTWFLSDQGDQPPFLLRDIPELATLRSQLNAAAADSRSWIDTRPTTARAVLTTVGVTVLTQPEQVEARHRRLVPPGQSLGIVDPPGWSRDIAMVTWDWVGTADSLAAARGLFPSSGIGHGFVIVEQPPGVFNVAKTNPVSEKGLSGTFTANGLLTSSTFVHVWLQLATADGIHRPALTPVY
ncbi:hypothetical protein ACWD4O_42195 [Streptomyces sp. NPDC002623]